MSCVIKTHPNPTTKQAIRDAIISKEMVRTIGNEEDFDLAGWLFGEHFTIYFILNNHDPDWYDKLQKIYCRYQRAKTDTTRNKNLELLVDMIHERLEAVFTRSNRQKYIDVWQEEKAKWICMPNHKIIQDWQTLVFAPLWKNVK